MKWTPCAFWIGAVAACGPAVDAGRENLAPTAQQPAPSNRIDIPPVVRKNLGITFAPVEEREISEVLRVPGSFELLPRARREYRMALPGHVELLVDQYESVELGQALFRYRSPAWPELQHEILVAEQALATGSARIDVGAARRTEVERQLASIRARLDALSEADFKDADLELEAAQLAASLPRLDAEQRLVEAQLANAERSRAHALHVAAAAVGLTPQDLATVVDGVPAYARIDWLEIHATGPGVVQTLAVTDGAFVEPTALVLTSVDPSMVRFRAPALQTDLPRLTAGGAARVVPASTGLDDRGVSATLAVGLEASPSDRTAALLATPATRAAWMRPGHAAFLEVTLDTTGGATLALPSASVVRDGLEHVFFRRDPEQPDQAIRVVADLGIDDGRWVAVHSGVRVGDEVVLAGVYELRLATQQRGTVQAGGHFHADGTFHAGDD